MDITNKAVASLIPKAIIKQVIEMSITKAATNTNIFISYNSSLKSANICSGIY